MTNINLQDKDSYLPASFKVESLISVDERGQMILPKELREKASIKAGDKFLIFSWEKDEHILCISLIKTDDFSHMIKNYLDPLVKDIWKNS